MTFKRLLAYAGFTAAYLFVMTVTVLADASAPDAGPAFNGVRIVPAIVRR